MKTLNRARRGAFTKGTPQIIGQQYGAVPAAGGAGLLYGLDFWIDADLSSLSGGKVTNLGNGGSALDITNGATTTDDPLVDTNEPHWFRYSGTRYFGASGVSGNWISTPDAASLDATSELECIARGSFATFANQQGIMAKATSGAASTWQWGKDSSGFMNFLQASTGATLDTTSTSSVTLASLGLSATTIYWWRMTWRASDGRVQFFYAADTGDNSTIPSSWTQIGSDRTGLVGNMTNTNQAVGLLASRSGGTQAPCHGSWYRFIMRKTIDGSNDLDVNVHADTTASTTTTFTATSGQTMTINRSSTGKRLALVHRSMWVFGTDDYMTLADTDALDIGASDAFTIVVIAREWTANTTDTFAAKRAATTGAGWALRADATTATSTVFAIGDGTVNDTTTEVGTRAAGAIHCLVGVRDVSNDKIRVYVDGVTDADDTDDTTATLANTSAFTIGRNMNAGTPDYLDGEVFGVAFVKGRALSTDDIAIIRTYYGTA